jgi:outer membrane cobalamin receptor
MKTIKQIIVIILLLLTQSVVAQDTLKREILREVRIISGKVPPSEVISQTPVHVVSYTDIERINASQLSDALRGIGSLVVRDYGGVGGVKTVSARGLGSQFSTLTLDGVAVSDCQNGQIDLGRYMLENVEYISFANGNTDNIFQTARSFAAGNVIDVQSKEPKVYSGNKTNMKLKLESGSFGLINPSLSIDQHITDRFKISLWGTYMQSDGDYPFTLYYTNSRTDSSSREYRKNSEVKMGIVDMNIFYRPDSKQKLTTKVHYNQSYRNLPGPTTYYTQKTSERLYDKVFFTQINYQNIISDKWKIQVNGKYNLSENIYEDTAALNSDNYLRNEYLQNEGYISGTAQYAICKSLKIALSSDGAINTLNSNMQNNNDVDRYSWLNVLAMNYKNKYFNLSANILSTTIKEYVSNIFTKDYQRVSPYVGLSIKPFENYNLRIRYFFKENYRIPNFNEMYYYTIAKDLNPEKALQNNLGISYSDYSNENIYLTATVDGYFNRVSDKIVAIPSQNLFLWSMMNIGRVDILGLDAKVEVSLSSFAQKFTLSAAVNYSYQSAKDKTAANSKTYNQQIPYTPKHSGGGMIYLEIPKYFNMGYNLIYVGDRYRLAQNTENNLVQGYVDQSFLVSKSIKLKTGTLSMQAQVLNIFDIQYEVIKNYPMMGRNYKINISYSF